MLKALVLLFVIAVVITVTSAKVDPSSISVSGLSSGAYFAVQYQVAYSATIKGAAILAGGPFYCAQDSLTDAFMQCMEGLESIDLGTLEDYARNQAASGNIDGLGNLTSHNVYLYSGEFDITVKPSVVKSLEQMYRDLGVSNINTEYSILSAHTFPTTNYGNLCLESMSPYISNCAYDGAGNALQTIYGSLSSPVTPNNNNIITLPQSKFTNGASPSSLSLDNTAYIYVPSGCKNNATSNCKLHFALHGCLQYYGTVGSAFVEDAGYNGWAEANNIIIAYPQTIESSALQNPNGCWDWWGYLDGNYATKQGKQMQFMKNLQDFIVNNF